MRPADTPNLPMVHNDSHPFRTTYVLQKPGFVDRLRRRQPRSNAVLELKNMLVAGVSGLTSESFASLLAAYNLTIQDLRDNCQRIYHDYLWYCLANGQLTDAERQDLDHLATTFGLASSFVQDTHQRLGGEVYTRITTDVAQKMAMSESDRAMLEALREHLGLSTDTTNQIIREKGESVYDVAARRIAAKRGLSQEDSAYLDDLRASFGISEAAANRIVTAKAQAVLQEYVDQAIADERISPDEWHEMHAIAEAFGTTFRMNQQTRAQMDRYRLYWDIEQGQVPEVAVPINLQRQERCHFGVPAEWYEYRTQTKRIGYSGPSARVRLAKGVYWRVGSVNVQRVTEDVLRLLDSGQLYLTNKRLLFVGLRGSKTVRLNRVLDFVPHTNGVEIIKDAGRNPFLAFSSDIDLFSLTLDRLLRDQ